MRSNIQANIPPRITITPKENIPALTGTVIEPKYHLSIGDYLQFNTSVNGVIDVLNNINYYHSNLDFLSVLNLTSGLEELISSCFICITSLNGQPITEETRNINVLKRFTINGQKYMPNEQNYGNITLPDRYISGQPSSFVQSFNGRYGNVSGAIEQIRMNGEIQPIVDGVVDLTGVIRQDGFVSKINNKIENIYLMNQVKCFNVNTFIDAITFKSRLNNAILTLKQIGTPYLNNFLYRLNNSDVPLWIPYEIDTPITLNLGESVSFHGDSEHFSRLAENRVNWYYHFDTEGYFDVEGNINSLINYSTTLDNYCFIKLFFYSNIVDASKLLLPTLDLSVQCYYDMFNGCTALTAAPALPATGLAYYCYFQMFKDCHSLTKVPLLPATNLKDYCYADMFLACNSLSTVPHYMLPATELKTACYYGMFWYCTSLITTPILPATELVPDCYCQMFYGCTNLSSIEVNFTDWKYNSDTDNCISTWVGMGGTVTRGIFTKPAALPLIYDAYHIPPNWIVINK